MAGTVYGIKDNKCLVPIEMGGGGGAEIEIGTYTGDGATSRVINLGYKPRFVFVFAQSKPFTTLIGVTGEIHVYSAASDGAHHSKGLTADASGFKCFSSKAAGPDGTFNKLNESNQIYVYLAIK